MDPKKPREPMDLEKILEEEQNLFKAAAMRGEFGELSTFYTSYEQKVVHAAGFVDAKIPYASAVLQYARTIFGEIGKSIASLRKHKFFDIIDDEKNIDPEEPTTPNIKQELLVTTVTVVEPELPAKNSGQLVYFPGIHSVHLPASTMYLSKHAQRWANQRVVSELVQRLYTQLITAEQTLSENTDSIEKNKGKYSSHRDELWEQEIILRMELLQKDTYTKELVRMHVALAEDCTTAKDMVNTYLRFLYTPDGDEIALMRKELDRHMRNVATFQAEADFREREHHVLSQRITYLSLQVEEKECERIIMDEGLQKLEEAYIFVGQNKMGVMHWRSLIDQHNMRYEAWKEALQYAQHIPAPADVKPIVDTMEQQIDHLQKAYEKKYELAPSTLDIKQGIGLVVDNNVKPIDIQGK